MKKTGLKHISEITGFSVATVSNALSGKRGVNPETAAAVLKVARETGYLTTQNIKRLKLVTVRSGGKILDDTPFFSSILEGVSEECTADGFELSFFTLDLESPLFQDQLKQLSADMNSAIILMGTEMTGTEYRYFEALSNPIVTLDYWCPNRRYNGVEFNNFDSARAATEHLIAMGHQKIGYLRGEYRIRAFRERERGYKAVLEVQGLEYNPCFSVTLSTNMDGAFRDMAAHLAASPDLPTAFFADNDIIALGAMKALQDAGLRVPQDVSVIGFDNLPYCRISVPSLTTMDAPARQMGRMAVRRMKDVLSQRDVTITRTQICATVVERDSVANIAAE